MIKVNGKDDRVRVWRLRCELVPASQDDRP
jgi:hypothetical protein